MAVTVTLIVEGKAGTREIRWEDHDRQPNDNPRFYGQAVREGATKLAESFAEQLERLYGAAPEET